MYIQIFYVARENIASCNWYGKRPLGPPQSAATHADALESTPRWQQQDLHAAIRGAAIREGDYGQHLQNIGLSRGETENSKSLQIMSME
jgi:hypothetical protein